MQIHQVIKAFLIFSNLILQQKEGLIDQIRHLSLFTILSKRSIFLLRQGKEWVMITAVASVWVVSMLIMRHSVIIRTVMRSIV